MARAITKCPNCDSTVTQFAAGCAICGEDLGAARAARKRGPLPSVPAAARLPHVALEDALVGGLMIVVAFASPLLGGVLAGLFAYQAHKDRNTVRRNLCLVGVGVAVVMICLLSLFPGAYSRLLFSIYG